MTAMPVSSPQDKRSGGILVRLKRWLGYGSGDFDEDGSPASPARAAIDDADTTFKSGRTAHERVTRSASPPTVGSPYDLPDDGNSDPPLLPPEPKARMMFLLQSGEGASVAEIAEVTGWQAHSVRAALSGLRKRGMAIERIGPRGQVCRYRGEPVGDAAAASASLLAAASASAAAISPSVTAVGPGTAAASSAGLSDNAGDARPVVLPAAEDREGAAG